MINREGTYKNYLIGRLSNKSPEVQEIGMETEKGVMIVAYKQGDSNPRFLVLKRKKNWEGWETPKGRLENNDYEETVRQELEEEAGISGELVREIRDLDQEVSWEYERDGEKRKKEYRGYLVKVAEGANVDVRNNPHDEHEKGFFFRPRDAKPLLEYDDNRELLEKAAEKIGQQS